MAYKFEAKHLYFYQSWLSKYDWIQRYSIKNKSSVPESPNVVLDMSVCQDIKTNLMGPTLVDLRSLFILGFLCPFLLGQKVNS